MQLRRDFQVRSDFDEVCAVLSDERTLIGLFPDATAEILDREGDRCTLRTRYVALGQPGEATFRFDHSQRDHVTFEKVCDGKVWKRLRGELIAEQGGAGTAVHVRLQGATKAFVPEIAIKVPMERQIDEMVEALRARLG